jgi:hypothetical protein
MIKREYAYNYYMKLTKIQKSKFGSKFSEEKFEIFNELILLFFFDKFFLIVYF